MSEIISQYGMLLLGLGCLFGFFMAWGVGANDVANAMGTSVGARAVTIKQAIFIEMVFEFTGAYLAGGAVTSTIRSGIIDLERAGFADSPELLVYGMLSSLLAAGIWLMAASAKGWPVSTTHSIVGAIVGFALVGISVDAVVWSSTQQTPSPMPRSMCPIIVFWWAPGYPSSSFFYGSSAKSVGRCFARRGCQLYDLQGKLTLAEHIFWVDFSRINFFLLSPTREAAKNTN